MPDVFSKKKRSEVMSRIRSRGNKQTKVALARLLRANRIWGWRRHLRVVVDSTKLIVDRPKRPQPGYQPSTKNYQLAVRPDFVFPKLKLATRVCGRLLQQMAGTARGPRAMPPSGERRFPATKPATCGSIAPCGAPTGACCGFGNTISPGEKKRISPGAFSGCWVDRNDAVEPDLNHRWTQINTDSDQQKRKDAETAKERKVFIPPLRLSAFSASLRLFYF